MKLRGLLDRAQEVINALDRISELEDRVESLEAQLEQKSTEPCPDCGFPLFPAIETGSSGPFDDLGVTAVTRRCPRCGAQRQRHEH